MSIGMLSLVSQKPADATGGLKLIVSGEDANNKPFRENATVLSLQGRDCTYESRLRMQPGSSLMVEIPPAQAGEQAWRAAAIVETICPAGPGQDLFHISVVLGRSYEPPTVSRADSLPIPAQPGPVAAVNAPQPAVIPRAEVMARPVTSGAKSGELERIAGALRPLITQIVCEAVAIESERHMPELQNQISQQLERAVKAPVAELTQYAKTLPAANEEIIRQTVERAAEQQLARTTALLQPVIEETARKAAVAESGRQARELKDALSREIESAVQEPLAAMAQYTQSLPAVDEETVRRLVGQAAEAQFERSIAALRPAIAEILRSAIAVEYRRQSQELKTEIFNEVGKAVQGPVALQMAAMLDMALTARMAQDPQQTPTVGTTDEKASIQELVSQLQARLDSQGGTMRCMLEPQPAGSDAIGNGQPPSTGGIHDL
jgi:hypothetical protein